MSKPPRLVVSPVVGKGLKGGKPGAVGDVGLDGLSGMQSVMSMSGGEEGSSRRRVMCGFFRGRLGGSFTFSLDMDLDVDEEAGLSCSLESESEFESDSGENSDGNVGEKSREGMMRPSSLAEALAPMGSVAIAMAAGGEDPRGRTGAVREGRMMTVLVSSASAVVGRVVTWAFRLAGSISFLIYTPVFLGMGKDGSSSSSVPGCEGEEEVSVSKKLGSRKDLNLAAAVAMVEEGLEAMSADAANNSSISARELLRITRPLLRW